MDNFWKPEACGETVLPDSWTRVHKMPKIANFDEFLKTLIFSETVLPDKSVFQKTKISGKCQNWKLRHFWVIFKHCDSVYICKCLF